MMIASNQSNFRRQHNLVTHNHRRQKGRAEGVAAYDL